MSPDPTPETDTPARQSLFADRGVSPVQGRFGGRPGKLVAIAALLLGCGVFLAATWDRGEARDPATRETEAAPRQATPFEPARRDPPMLEAEDRDPDVPPLGPEVPPLESAPSAAPTPSQGDERRTLAESARRAPVMAYSRPGAGPVGDLGASASPPPTPTQTPTQTSAAGALQVLRQAEPVDRAIAGRLTDRNLLITAGTSLPCLLQTAMDSTTPGYVSCVLPRDVYSDNGAVVLLERGTRVLGEHSSSLQQGRRRLFVLWTRAVTPTGVAVSLASPAADALGRAGIDGAVETRFWDRFGGALLLSLVDDGAYAAFGEDGRGGQTARLPSDAAAAAVQRSIDIPPTLRKAQGSEVTILVAQDLDFRGVYRLRPR